MFLLVCYDIPDDRRRSRVGKILEGYGNRVQKSVFECDLTPKQIQRLKLRLMKVIQNPDDSLRYYCLCAQCVGRIEVINGPRPIESQLCFIV
ncbi:MAG: CRISPR-associated endonuclease Cas2 [Dethiobacter sp.]